MAFMMMDSTMEGSTGFMVAGCTAAGFMAVDSGADSMVATVAGAAFTAEVFTVAVASTVAAASTAGAGFTVAAAVIAEAGCGRYGDLSAFEV